MSAKSRADLTTQNTAIITGVSSPDGIKPATLGPHEQDIIDSMWNKLDDPAPANTDAVALASLTIPSVFTGLFTNGDPLTLALQAMFNLLNQLDSTMSIQGKAGMFLATITELTRQTIGVDNASVTAIANLSLPNDVTDGGFDNGNNWDTNSYVAPAVTGFNGRFELSGIEVELVSKAGTAGTATLTFQMQKNGVNYGSSMTVVATLADAIGTKYYSSSLCSPAIASPVDTLAPGDIITVLIKQQKSSTDNSVLRINSAIFKNQDV